MKKKKLNQNSPWNGYPGKYGVMFNVETAIRLFTTQKKLLKSQPTHLQMQSILSNCVDSYQFIA